MSMYLQYVLSTANCGMCSKGDVRRSQLHDKTQQMHCYSQQHCMLRTRIEKDYLTEPQLASSLIFNFCKLSLAHGSNQDVDPFTRFTQESD